MLRLLIVATVSLATIWLMLLLALWLARPRVRSVRDAVTLVPETVRLFKNVMADPDVPQAVRWRVAFLLAYLALPFDLVPDFIPIIGYADDVIVVLWVLRSAARRVGVESLRRAWRGSDEGFSALCRIAGIDNPS